MTVLYVTEPGSVVRHEAGSLAVWREEEAPTTGGAPVRRKLAALEPHRVETLVLLGGVRITGNAMRICAINRVPIALLNADGSLAARVEPPLSRTADLRLRQYELRLKEEERLVRARAIVAGKLANARAVLRSIASNYPSDDISRAIARLENAQAEAAQATEPAGLLGIEGSGAQAYFAALGTAFRGDITFSTRLRRPPPDPANALLSFAYVLLMNRIAGLLEARGADVCLGFLHELRPGRPSLALDLLEEFRHPVVDRLVLRLCNLKRLRPEHFEPDVERPGGVRLSHDGRRLFLAEWETQLARPLREIGLPAEQRLDTNRLVRRQVDRLVTDLRGGEPYLPFRFGG